MKKLFLAIGILFLSAAPASAHVLKVNGTIGAVIHIDPEDNPIIAEPATFFLTFKDTSQRFSLADCTCDVQVLSNGKQVFTQPLSPGSSSLETSFTYTFPSAGVYQVEITGKPTTAGAFDAFQLNYNLRVTRTSGAKVSSNVFHSIHYGVIVGAILIAGAVSFVRARRAQKLTSV